MKAQRAISNINFNVPENENYISINYNKKFVDNFSFVVEEMNMLFYEAYVCIISNSIIIMVSIY